jgi:hypothetical protein
MVISKIALAFVGSCRGLGKFPNGGNFGTRNTATSVRNLYCDIFFSFYKNNTNGRAILFRIPIELVLKISAKNKKDGNNVSKRLGDRNSKNSFNHGYVLSDTGTA